jgi:type II secretory pathway pseudopilin PulG
MELAGQGSPGHGRAERSRLDDRGYVLVVLLIGMAISAIWLAAALPAWRQQAQRERETELIFRGEQYARAVALYYKKYGALPTDVDVLVSQRFLRKKWKDPVTDDDFTVLYSGQAAAGSGGGAGSSNRGGGGQGAPGSTARGSGTQFQVAGSGGQRSAGTGTPTVQNGGLQPQGGGGMIGVVSKSTATSIKIYNNLQEYDLWQFTYQAQCQKMGGCTPPGAGGATGGGTGRGRQGTTGRGGQQGGGAGNGGIRGRGGQQGPGGAGGGRGGGGGGPIRRGGGGGPIRGGGGGGLS